MAKEIKYICSGYYADGVCKHRGDLDPECGKAICLSNGKSPFTGDDCVHCLLFSPTARTRGVKLVVPKTPTLGTVIRRSKKARRIGE